MESMDGVAERVLILMFDFPHFMLVWIDEGYE